MRCKTWKQVLNHQTHYKQSKPRQHMQKTETKKTITSGDAVGTGQGRGGRDQPGTWQGVCGLGCVRAGRGGRIATRLRQRASDEHRGVGVKQRRLQRTDGIEVDVRQAAGEAERAQPGQVCVERSRVWEEVKNIGASAKYRQQICHKDASRWECGHMMGVSIDLLSLWREEEGGCGKKKISPTQFRGG